MPPVCQESLEVVQLPIPAIPRVSPVSDRTALVLRAFATDAPLQVRVRGDCMAPLLESGATVSVASRRFYWPGDLVVVHALDGRLLVHRLLGCYARKGRLRWLTQADAAPRPDPALAATQIVGKVVGGEGHPHANQVPLRHRLWACGRFLRHAMRATQRWR